MMRAVHVDFVRPPPARMAGRIVLFAGLAVLTTAIACRTLVAVEVDRLRAQITERQRVDSVARLALAPPPADPIALARRDTLLRELRTPWEPLFQSIEQTRVKEVRVVSVVPDAAARVVRIVGEAKRFEDATAYVDRLGVRRELREVRLLGHRALAEAGGGLEFTVEASWPTR